MNINRNLATIQEGDIVFHNDYGFGIMMELPTFKGMQVIGIRSECMLADDLLQHLKQLLNGKGKENNAVEATDTTERIRVGIYKDLLVDLYDFAYKQAVKTNTVDELHDIDKRINGSE
jgi:hypothetical protein